jgi:hypothetical protein
VNFDDFRRRADAVREVPLESVLILHGGVRDRHDKSKWHTERGAVSVTGPQFMNWQRGQGGGGAIDLVMHLAQTDFCAAVEWLERHVAVGRLAAGAATAYSSGKELPSASRNELSVAPACHGLRLPVPSNRLLGRVRHYLTRRRRLAAAVIEPLVQAGRLYADNRANAVFVLVAGKPHRPVGAELRGTGPRVWRGMAPGTRKDSGYFWVGVPGGREIVLCESAIDALSCFQMHPDRICISTSGVRSNPRWLQGLLARGYRVHCGFDADAAGNAAATRMIALHPAVQRLRPPAHDWNDALTSTP